MDLLIGVKGGGGTIKLEGVSYQSAELTEMLTQGLQSNSALVLKGEKREVIVPATALTSLELVESAARPVGFLGHN